MIPDFDEHGNLHPGIHNATLTEVVAKFSGIKSFRRKDLSHSLWNFVSFLEPFAIGIYIDGSYTTSKLSPKDVDVIVILPEDFDYDSSEARRLRGYELDSKKNRLHIFVYRVVIQDQLIQKRKDWFSHDRNLNPKGIIYIEMRQ